jgi:hypothetical protein
MLIIRSLELHNHIILIAKSLYSVSMSTESCYFWGLFKMTKKE